MDGKIIGIDLGTTFSLVAVYNPDTRSVTVIPDEAAVVVPSAVYYPESGDPIVGQEAINAGSYAAERLIRCIKMNMGTDFQREIGDKKYTPVEISAEILKKLKKLAESYLNVEPDDFSSIVITVPAYFKDAPCAATLKAAELAWPDFDMKKVRLFREPCAAALAYVAEANTDLSSGPRNVLVSDLGGGTYDATIIRTDPKRTADGGTYLDIEVKCKDGSQELGGVLWDEALEEHVKGECAANGHPQNDVQDASQAHIMREAVIRAKELMSTISPVKVSCCTGNVQEVPVETFNEVTAGLRVQVEEKLRSVVEEFKQENPDENLDVVLLAGGASKMPQIKELVKDITGLEPQIHRTLEQLVAIGAAYEAAIESGAKIETQGKDRGIELRPPKDIPVSAIGVRAKDTTTMKNVNSIIIPKGTPNETEKRNKDRLGILADNQATIEFVILEGDSEDADQCEFLGSATLNLPPNQPRGQEVEVYLSIDENGIVVGRGVCKTTEGNKEVPIQIERRFA